MGNPAGVPSKTSPSHLVCCASVLRSFTPTSRSLIVIDVNRHKHSTPPCAMRPPSPYQAASTFLLPPPSRHKGNRRRLMEPNATLGSCNYIKEQIKI
ncbi:hypothetical protein E2C01_084536 [Portunus trituberculatus]|uniref:Uncharacterized protein n=1 Tax=Portunus trituberculatus TaxID=210409 RepID=A0A5B7J095_PORTR|nr:hypothetical protein [Portunus trituberculatus]